MKLQDLTEFIIESNHIENERSEQAHWDAMNAFWIGINIWTPFSEFNIREIHLALMKNLNPKIAGKYRECDVWVGSYKAPPSGEVKNRLKRWLLQFGGARKERTIKQAHIVFEKIHPFEDGNGRIGRLIMCIQRVKANLPIEIIYEKDKHKYYEWFSNDETAEKTEEYYKLRESGETGNDEISETVKKRYGEAIKKLDAS